jgi:hypothetical protein
MIFGRIGPKIKSDMAIKNKKLNGTNKTNKESSFAFRKAIPSYSYQSTHKQYSHHTSISV